jgi:SpoVK/Ycf46/Vps4 family AAA+-type ATPase
VDTIRKSWQQIFNNAAWHQPAVILFDDLDQLISAPSLLQENGPEAHYILRLAQGKMSCMSDIIHAECLNCD